MQPATPLAAPERRRSSNQLPIIATGLAAVAVVLLLMLRPWKSPLERVADDLGKAAKSTAVAYGDAMRTDLRNIATAQEAFFAERQRYAASLEELNSVVKFTPASGNDVLIYKGDEHGFRASATRAGLDGECYVWVGPRADFQVVSDEEGEPNCTGVLRVK